MNREEARELVKNRNFNLDVFDHILDSLDAIEARLENKPSKTIAQQYVTMAEYIAHRPEGMTAEEARQDFIERALANGAEVACTTLGRFAPIAGNKIMQFIGECRDDSIRLPLDDDGELPDYPLMNFPSISRKPFIIRSVGNKESWVKVADDKGFTIVSGKYKTSDAAKAMWNKWMRERFGVCYGEGE